MQGWQLTFHTTEDRRHGREPLHQWLVKLARELGIRGVTTRVGAAGIGRDGRLRSANFFELAAQPVEVMMVLDQAQCDALYARLAGEPLSLFYVRVPVEYGHLGAGTPED